MKVATHSAITAWRKDTELSSVEKVSVILAAAARYFVDVAHRSVIASYRSAQ